MGHEIDVTEGVASFADSEADAAGRVAAWHKLGTAVGHDMTVDEALDAANMRGWDVRKEPLTAEVGGVSLPVPGKHVVLRTNPVNGKTEALGVVGNHWAAFQNESTTALLGDITEASGAHLQTLGGLDGGRRTFATMKMPNWMQLTTPAGLIDRTDLYLSIFNWHDGGGSLIAQISPVRVVCANTQRMAESMAVSRVAIRHTGDPRSRIEEVRRLLGLTFKYSETYVEQCEALIAREMDSVVVLDIIEDVFGVGSATTEKQKNSRKATAEAVLDVYQTSPSVKPFIGTAFGAYNAVTEYLDHFAPVAGEKKMEAEEAAIRRAQRTINDGELGLVKARAFTALLPTA